ncbi:succinylglutamate desuccinylase/aspartoacylase family protein [Reyranella sp. CPCC 100927]|uniref:succinylglutamate desuccinylase/aspartoacylase family protein n=1 Tax=Reyranella sp. CPCC 100927 TaxID=2599616 RepID=UPI0011B64D53|nr:succinylglutamate desuccinylase/aspartoacylase family protein [Reyranella sp. CPCC 100927]TWT09603.1 succinylglutamate desuccinylase [Reyranella sp. CPCC 100927]
MTVEIVRFAGLEPGPKLLVLGAVHGNETCGTEAIRTTIADCRDGRLAVQRGHVTFVPIANRKAYDQGTREGDRNLNRDLHEYIPPQCYEDRVANVLCPLLREHDVLLDIHSFSGTGEPFVFVGPSNNAGPIEPFRWAAEEGAFAACLGPSLLMHGFLAAHVRAQQGLAQRGLPGTSWAKGVGTTEYMRQSGGYGVTIECGQHRDSQAPHVARRAIDNAMAHLGLIDVPAPARSARRAIEVIDAVYALAADDRLERPFVSGDAVKHGDIIARRADGEILTAARDGFVIFPQAKPKPLVEFYYFGIASARFPQP